MVLLSAIKNAAKRVPSIRFRAGQPQASASHGSQGNSSGSPQVSNTPPQRGHAIEDYQLPQRYKRRPIDESEIEMINSGFWLK
uniref:CSON013249 protein n=1 Tax=Culicoides sonorensis TaxID=179676 RepID=A0A336M7J9_CULSO